MSSNPPSIIPNIITTLPSSLPALPQFNDDTLFDGTNWFAWKDWVIWVTRLYGLTGYLDGSIAKPSPPATTATTASPTLWESTTPSMTEWDRQDAWVGTLIYNNTKNPIGVGIESSAAEMWAHLKNSYNITDEMAIIHVVLSTSNLLKMVILKHTLKLLEQTGQKQMQSEQRLVMLNSII